MVGRGFRGFSHRCPFTAASGLVRALRGVGAINYVTEALVEAFLEWHHIAWEMPLAQGAGCLEDVEKCVREPDCSRDHNQYADADPHRRGYSIGMSEGGYF